MTASYPNGIKTWTDKVDGVDRNSAADINGAMAEIIAAEGDLINNIKPKQADHDTEFAEATGYGIISGLDVSAQSTPDMTVAVATGTIHMPNGKRFASSATSSLAINAADTSNPRIDMVYVSPAGVISYLAGAAAASPTAPALPDGGLELAEIAVTANATAITAGNITDKRLIKQNNNQLGLELVNARHDNITNTDYANVGARMDNNSSELAEITNKVFLPKIMVHHQITLIIVQQFKMLLMQQ